MIETRFKDTEVGRIPEDWEIKKVQELTDIITGATPSTTIPQYWNGGSIRWMSSGELNYKFIYDVEGRITQLGYDNTGTHMLPKYCVLIGLAGQGKTRGTAALNYVEICTNQSIAAILPNIEIFNSLYLYYYVDSQYKYLRTLSAGDGGRGGLNKKTLLNLEIILPPQLSEQTRIATALSNIDSLISELDRLIEKKRAIKQGTMQELLTGKKRLKGFSEPWVEKKLTEIAETSSGGTPSRSNGSFYNGTIKWFTTTELKDCLLFDSNEHITENAIKFSSAKVFPKGTLLMAMYGATIGRLGILQDDAATNQACCAILANKSINTKFLFYYLYKQRDNIVSLGSGAGQPNISQQIVQCLTVFLPSAIAEQSAIASVLSSMDDEISALEAKKAKYEQIKQGMMQQLLTGKIRLVETAVKTNVTSANVHFRRSVLAAEIAERLYEEPTFGHVKMEKMLFLTERLCHIDIGSHYHRDAAGPYDNRALRSIDSQLKKQKWFEVRRTEKGNRYVPMQNCGKHKAYFDKYYSTVLPTFDKIIETFKTQNTERCEIVATLYSAWEDLLHSNKPFTDADIVNEVLNNWHESKKRISQDRWLNAIQWMRENGFAPKV